MMSVRKRTGLTHGLVYHNELRPAVSTDGMPAEGLVRSVLVDRVEPNGPAAHAGFQPGDVIVRAANVRVAGSLDLERAFLGHQAGEQIPVVVRRHKTEQRLELALQSAKAQVPGHRGDDLAEAWHSAASGGSRGGVRAERAAARRPGHRRDEPRRRGGQGGHPARRHPRRSASVEDADTGQRRLRADPPRLGVVQPAGACYIVRNGQVHRGWIQQVD